MATKQNPQLANNFRNIGLFMFSYADLLQGYIDGLPEGETLDMAAAPDCFPHPMRESYGIMMQEIKRIALSPATHAPISDFIGINAVVQAHNAGAQKGDRIDPNLTCGEIVTVTYKVLSTGDVTLISNLATEFHPSIDPTRAMYMVDQLSEYASNDLINVFDYEEEEAEA